jgi:hypothetical protein
MATSYTSLLGLALPVTGELQGAWGDVVNDSITSLLDGAVAGTTTLSTDGDVTLTTTTGAANQARQAILLCSGARTAIRTITAPAHSKIYTIINATTGGFDVKIVGVGPTTGISIPAGTSATVAWNGSDFIDATTFFNANPRFGAGTANGVLYLNANKQVTTGSALTFDGTTFRTLSGAVASGGSVNGKFRLDRSDGATNLGYIDWVTANDGMRFFNNNGGYFSWESSSAGELARLTSTGLGIGTTSPAAKLNVVGATTGTAILGYGAGTDPGTGDKTVGALNYYGHYNGGICASIEVLKTSNPDYFNGNIIFKTRLNDAGANTERMRLDNAGNLGLGVTPSAWGVFKGFDIASNAAISNGGTFAIASNAYYNGTAWTYKSTAVATLYQQQSGAHQWYTAPSGTAGDAITFTQAMTLDASGRLIIGGTSAGNGPLTINSNTSGYSFQTFQYNSSVYGYVGQASAFSGSGSNTDFSIYAAQDLTFYAGGSTERARIDSSGNLLIGTTDAGFTSGAGFKFGVGASPSSGTVGASSSNGDITYRLYSTGAAAYRFYVGFGGTVYATSNVISAISDQRFKENVRDLDSGLAEVMALKPRLYDWKEGKGADIKNARGFIAQEFEQVFPDLIDEWRDPAPEGEEPYKSVRQDLIPVLVKAIQEQQAIIDSLKARLDAANL